MPERLPQARLTTTVESSDLVSRNNKINITVVMNIHELEENQWLH